MKNYEEKLVAIAADHKKVISECNKVALTAKKSELDGFANRIKEYEKEYLKIRSQQVYSECPEIIDAIKRHTFTTLGSKRENKDGVFVGYTIQDAVEQLDLHDYCEHKGLDLAWYYNAQAFGKRVTLRVADDLGIPASRVKTINDSYSMHAIASEIDLGKTPTSNNQMVQHLQRVLNELCPEAGKVNSHDIAYILYRVSKVSNKNLMAVGVAATNRILSAIGTAFYRVATNGMYDVDFKTREGSTTPDNSAPEGEKSEGKKKDGKKSSKGKVGGITRSKNKKEAVEAKEETVEVAKPEAKAAN